MKLINTGINQSMKQWTLNTIYRCVGNKDMSNCLQSSSSWTFLQCSTQQITRLSCLSSWILEFVAQPGNSLLLTWRDSHHASCRRSAGVPQGWSLALFRSSSILFSWWGHILTWGFTPLLCEWCSTHALLSSVRHPCSFSDLSMSCRHHCR